MSSHPTELAGPLRPLVQVTGFIRKELTEILRQPRLVLLMVVGPFLVLAMFAVGFDQQQSVIRAVFVGPEDSVYEQAVDEFAEDLEEFVESAGYTTDVIAAQDRLRDGDVDVVVVFPAEPTESIRDNERAQITVLHDEIDPIRQVTVDVSTQVAVQELNSRILESVLGGAQSSLRPLDESLDTTSATLDELADAVADGRADDVTAALDGLDSSTSSLRAVVDVSQTITDELDGESEGEFADLSAAASALDEGIASLPDDLTESDVEALQAGLDAVREQAELVSTLDPQVIVRPFEGNTESLERQSVGVDDFFAPAAIALLLQHMVLTFAAMSLVRDRSLGLFELFRVGPVGPGRILVSKFAALLLIGSASAAVLLAAMRFGLGLPLRGDITWLVVGVVGVLIASTAMGLVISMLARSDSQAVQYALLVLLAGLFFGGFFLAIESFSYPVRALSYALPVTYATDVFRDVMLRGSDPDMVDVLGLGVTSVVYGTLAALLFGRQLRVR